MIRYIEYSQFGKPISDFDIENEYNNLIKSNNAWHKFSTENIFHRIRLGIIKKEIDYKNYLFVFNDIYIYSNKYGQFINWPETFCEQNMKINETILREMIKSMSNILVVGDVHGKINEYQKIHQKYNQNFQFKLAILDLKKNMNGFLKI